MAEVSAAAEATPIVVANKSSVIQAVKDDAVISGVTMTGLAVGLLLAPFWAKKFKGLSASEVVATIFDLLIAGMVSVVKRLSGLVKRVISNKVAY